MGSGRGVDERRVRTALFCALVMAVATGCTAPAARRAEPSPLSSPAVLSSSRSVAAESSRTVASGWVGTWAVGVQGGGRSFARQTLRQIVHTSIGGGSARLRLSNEFGSGPLTVGGVRIARPTGGAGVDPATSTPVTFGGSGSVTIGAGKVVVSDDTAFVVPADGDVAISVYLPSATGASTQHALAGRNNYLAAGDQTATAGLRGARPTKSYYFLAGLDVRNAEATGAVVAFGASITDGLGSAFGTDRRWPDLLADRLRESGRTVGVLNVGISANRLIAGGYGRPARERFASDALRQPGVRWVILSDNALNDLGSGNPPGVDELTGTLRDLADQAHAAGVKVICSTLTPYRGAGYWSSRGERGRAAVNAFVRGSGSGCDAVLDQDTATHDPAAPTRFRGRFDSGDHLHPNPAGMAAIAGAADLDWFGPPA